MRASDIDDDAVRIERLGKKCGVDDESRTVQRLCGPKHGAAERMSNHDVVADFDGKQRVPLIVRNELCDNAALRLKQTRQALRQLTKWHRWGKEDIEARVRKQIERGGQSLGVCPAWPM